MSDQEIRERMGLEHYLFIADEKEKNKGIEGKQYFFITEDSSWTYVMDDWYYSLWFEKGIRDRIKLLSGDFDIFTFSVGDSDNSFDFSYLQKGEYLRQYVVEDPTYKGGEVVINTGKPFPIEDQALAKQEPIDKVIMIAKSLGIVFTHTKENVRVYGRFEKEEEKFIFHEDEY